MLAGWAAGRWEMKQIATMLVMKEVVKL